MIIAVDFDGTIVEHRYPAIGKELPSPPQPSANSWKMAPPHPLDRARRRSSPRSCRLLRTAWSKLLCRQQRLRGRRRNRQAFFEKNQSRSFIDDRNVGGLPDWPTIYALIKKKMNLRDFLISEEIIEPPVKKKGWWPF